MKIIIHIGMGKSGSTALQEFFSRSTEALSQQKILYPKASHSSINHNLLVVGISEFKKLPRGLKQYYGSDAVKARQDYQRQIRDFEAQIKASRPNIVLFSGEFLFRVPEDKMFSEFVDFFYGLADEVQVVAYIREPASWYLSLVQQTLKASGSFPPPYPIRFRPSIEAYRDAFKGQMNVVAFESSQLVEDDIITDFIHRFIPELSSVRSSFGNKSNESMSAEAMSILQDYRRLIYLD